MKPRSNTLMSMPIRARRGACSGWTSSRWKCNRSRGSTGCSSGRPTAERLCKAGELRGRAMPSARRDSPITRFPRGRATPERCCNQGETCCRAMPGALGSTWKSFRILFMLQSDGIWLLEITEDILESSRDWSCCTVILVLHSARNHEP